MSASMRTRPAIVARCALLAALLGTFLGIFAATAVSGAARWTERLTQQALDSGFLTRLPPTVSLALGLAKAKEGTDVRQLINKSGHQVRTFNVSVARHEDLVLFSVDAQTGATAAYLVGPDARLRKAVSYQAGKEAEEMPAADARAGFTREARFWAARARQPPPPPRQAPAPAAQ
jgi:hypothetical protein